MLLVLTDGDISGRDSISRKVADLAARGVATLWVSTDPAGWAPDAATRVDLGSPDEFGAVVDAALVRVLATT